MPAAVETYKSVKEALSLCNGGVRPIPTKENIVYTCKLSHFINIQDAYIKSHHLGPQFNRKRFPALVLRRYKSGAILVFEKGKIVCTGAKSTEHAREYINSTVEHFRSIGYTNLKLVDHKIHNMVGAVRLDGRFDLDKVHKKLNTTCNYEPDNFPGAVLRFSSIKPIAILVFRSGSIVITGATSYRKITEAFDYVYPILEKLLIPKGMNSCLADFEEDILDGIETQTDKKKEDYVDPTSLFEEIEVIEGSIIPNDVTDAKTNNKRKQTNDKSKSKHNKKKPKLDQESPEEMLMKYLRGKLEEEEITYNPFDEKINPIDTPTHSVPQIDISKKSNIKPQQSHYTNMPLLPQVIDIPKSFDMIVKTEIVNNRDDEYDDLFGSESD